MTPLSRCRPEKLAVITMHEVLNNILLQGGITKLTQLTIAISNAVQAEISMAKLRYQVQSRLCWHGPTM